MSPIIVTGTPLIPMVCAPFRFHSEKPSPVSSTSFLPSIPFLFTNPGRQAGLDRLKHSAKDKHGPPVPWLSTLAVGSVSLCFCPDSALGTQQVARDTSLLRASVPIPQATVCAPTETLSPMLPSPA